MLTGGCYCGAVRYAADGPAFHATICHCADCRRVVGAPAVAWFSVPSPGFRFTAGTPAAYRSSAHALRRFCGTCGTSLTFEDTRLPHELDLTIASLDEPGAMPPADHCQGSKKLAWERLDDGLPVFPTTRP